MFVGVLLVFGLVPLGGQPRSLASSAWWSPASPSPSPPWRRQWEGDTSGDSPPNKLVVESMLGVVVIWPSLSCRQGGGGGRGARSWLVLHRCCLVRSLRWRYSAPSIASQVAMVGKGNQGRDGGRDWVGAHLRWLLMSGYGAHCGVW